MGMVVQSILNAQVQPTLDAMNNKLISRGSLGTVVYIVKLVVQHDNGNLIGGQLVIKQVVSDRYLGILVGRSNNEAMLVIGCYMNNVG
jgi:hypothetical protein